MKITYILLLASLIAITGCDSQSTTTLSPKRINKIINEAKKERLMEQETLESFFPDCTLSEISAFVDYQPIIPSELINVELNDSQTDHLKRVVAFSGNAHVTAYTQKQLALLPNFKYLRSFQTFGESNDDTLRMLSKVKTIEILLLSGNFSAQGFRELKNLPQLRVLGAQKCVKDNESLQAICDIPTIEQLSIRYNSNISKEGYRAIGKLKRLKALDCSGNLTFESVETWTGLKEIIVLRAGSLNDDSLEVICNLTSLQSLDILGETDNVAQGSFRHLSKLINLKELKIGDIDDPKDFDFITKLPVLEQLSISTDNVDILKTIPKLKSLKALHFICFEGDAQGAVDQLKDSCPDLLIRF